MSQTHDLNYQFIIQLGETLTQIRWSHHVVVMLSHRLRRWDNIATTWDQRLVFVTV